MSVIITKEDLMAYAEVDYIIHHMNEKYEAKLPKNLVSFFSSIKDPNHKVDINPFKPLQNQGLQKYTLEIIALLHVKYWCENPQRKEELLQKMKENQERFEEKIKEQFSTENLFSGNQSQNRQEDEMVKAFSKYTNHPENELENLEPKEEKQEEELSQNMKMKQSVFKKIQTWFVKIFKKSTD